MSATANQGFFTEALARARARRTDGDLDGAWRELRIGLDVPVTYSQAVTAAKFLENTAQGAPPSGWPARRVALIGADTLTFFKPLLRALAFRDGWWPMFYEAPFGTWRQEILEAQSGLHAFHPEVTLVLRSWRSTALEEIDPERLLNEEIALARCAREGLDVVVWPAYDLPEVDSALRSTLAKANTNLHSALPPGILWLDLAELQATVGPAWQDERLWEAVRQHPSPIGSVAVVEAWLALLRARWGRMRKALVTDLDNVLWGGIVGEDGVDGIRLDPAQIAYQQYLLDLKNRGVLLAVCSKNNYADAREVFARRKMPLKREDFVGWMVNWNDKAENLRALAVKLQLGLDSFVFVDDNPAERARIRQALPEVAAPELPEDPSEYVETLKHRRFFDTTTVSDEDRGRTTAYLANEQREEMRTGSTSLEDFLRGLEMTAEHEPFSEATLDRVEQLLARSNQWNLTTRRHSHAEIAAFTAQPGVLTQWFRLRDRFGDHGLVGLWMLVPRGEGEWEIDSWVMSCRVIARGLEDLMFNAMVESVHAAGAKRLRGVFRPTAKNGLVANFLPGLGFELVRKSGNEEQVFILDLSKVVKRQHFIRA